jgi:hypothetical protein
MICASFVGDAHLLRLVVAEPFCALIAMNLRILMQVDVMAAMSASRHARMMRS